MTSSFGLRVCKIDLESYELSIVLSVKKAKSSRHMHMYICIFLYLEPEPNLSPVFLLEFLWLLRDHLFAKREKSLSIVKTKNYLETNSEPIASMYGLFTYI